MRLVALSESPADEAAIRILVEAIRGTSLDWVESPPWRSRGWPAVVDELPIVIKHLHYLSDATGIVVVVDTNSSPLHEPEHNAEPQPTCRLCLLRAAVDRTLAQLTAIPGRSTIRVAVGVATPAIEAWYLSGKKPHPSEQAWAAGGGRPYDRNALKRAVYGTDRPSLPLEISCARAEVTRISVNLDSLRTSFPRGFGMLETGVLAL